MADGVIRARYVLRAYLGADRNWSETSYRQALGLFQGVSPLVEPVPPDAADLDISGALAVWDLDARGVAAMVQVRLSAHLGLAEACLGLGGNRMVAAMAAALTGPGSLTIVGSLPEEARQFMRPLPVSALPGVGPTIARRLRRLGVHSIGTLADLPMETLQRVVGANAARGIHRHANGDDPRPVVPSASRPSLTHEYAFPADELDPSRHHAALVALAQALGAQLRADHHVAGSLALTVRYADGSTSTRTAILPEPTAHSPELLLQARRLYERLALQRARVRRLKLYVDDLRSLGEAVRQLSFDPGEEASRAAEKAADRVRARFGQEAVTSATLARLPGRMTR